MSLVSVIIPTHNHAQFLESSITSVLSQVQEYPRIEIIIVDDGSTDDPAAVVSQAEDPRLRLVRTDHRGSAAARNYGVAEASGEFIAFLDADDYWAHDKLARALLVLNEAKRIDQAVIHFSMMQEFIDPDLAQQPGVLPKVRLLRGINATCMTLSRNCFAKVGSFDESLESGEFIDWYLRAQRVGVATVVDPEVLAYRRIHENNRDRASRDSSKEYPRIMLRHLKERQASADWQSSE